MRPARNVQRRMILLKRLKYVSRELEIEQRKWSGIIATKNYSIIFDLACTRPVAMNYQEN